MISMNQQQWADARQSLKTVRDWVRFGASCFERANLFYGHGTDNPWDEAVALVLHALNLSHPFGEKLIDARLSQFEKDKLIEIFQERIIKRIPAPYITHKAYYAGFEFYVDKRVLIPRSPIAELIEKQFKPWVEPHHVYSILDMGTGSACLPILCAYYFPEALIDAVEIDKDALAVANINLDKFQLQEHIKLYQSDLFAALADKTYDVIICNPPYVDAEDMASLPAEFLHEPQQALASGVDGLSHINKILIEAKHHLNPEGILIAEVGNSASALELAYPQINFTWLEFERGGMGVFLLTYDQLKTIN